MPAPRSTRVAEALVLVLVGTLLLAFPFFSDFTTPKLLLAGLVCAPLLVLLATGRGTEPVLARPFLAVSGLLLLSLPAAMTAPDSARMESLLALDLAAFTVWLGAVRTAPPTERILPGWLLVGALGVLAFALAEAVAGEGFARLSALPGGATLGNPDFVAEFLAALTPLLCHILRHGSRAARVAAGAALAGSLWVLVGHDSATARVAASAGLLVWLATRGWRADSRLPLAAPLTALVLCFLGSVTYDQVPFRLLFFLLLGLLAARRRGCPFSRPGFRRLLVLAAAALVLVGTGWGLLHTRAGQGRAVLFRIALRVGLEAPLTGHGLGGFARPFMDEQGRLLSAEKGLRPWWTNARHAHNQLLQLWVERGLGPPLALVLFVLFCAWPGPALRGRFARRPWPLLGATLAALPLVLLPLHLAVVDLLFVRGEVARAHRLAPGHARLTYYHGLVDQAAGEDESAAKRLAASLDGHPNLTTPLVLGNVYSRLGQPEKAEAAYRQAIAWKPDYAAAYANLAVLFHRTDRPDAARRHVVRALSLRPSDPAVVRIAKEVCGGPRACAY